MSSNAQKRATNVSLRGDLLDRAREMEINISQACERGLELQIKELEGRRWLEENREAIESSNRYVAEHGLPLAKHRLF
ncbi:MAG: type II toxin-antitoxin system CcdA family antitoxin [Silvibacterium sp.]|nr:type II toxin-antitoxin system CcdA family antitoxin [Silvibacterium sp.]